MRKLYRTFLLPVSALLLIALPYWIFSGNGDDSWTTKELSVLSSMRLGQLPPTPIDPSNQYEKIPAAINLGKRLFSDQRFSKNNEISCANCHHPNQQFQDGRPLAQGMGLSARRAMPLVGTAYNAWEFWDGRKDSLWAQALGSFETAMSHGGNRLYDAKLMQAHYKREYEAAFNAMPDLSDLPKDASPIGSPAEKAAWEKIEPVNQEKISRVFVNMGKAIAAYQKTLRFGDAALDRYIQGVMENDPVKLKVLKPDEKEGLHIFIGKGECISCHNGPLLTDHAFHNVGVPTAKDGKTDPGRAAGLVKVEQDEFNCLGRFSDAKPENCEELRFMNRDKVGQLGNFKTQTLRNVALRPPYMHAGQFATLTDVVRHYVKAPPAVVGHNERDPMQLTEHEIKALVAFLGALSGPVLEADAQVAKR
jgi:cytochrome c peroxidase